MLTRCALPQTCQPCGPGFTDFDAGATSDTVLDTVIRYATGKPMHTLTAKSLTRERLSSSSTVMALLGAALLGAVILFGVGFSNMTVAHNAAHDMRHANGFPCH